MRAFKWEIPKKKRGTYYFRKSTDKWHLMQYEDGHTMELKGERGVTKVWMHPDDWEKWYYPHTPFCATVASGK